MSASEIQVRQPDDRFMMLADDDGSGALDGFYLDTTQQRIKGLTTYDAGGVVTNNPSNVATATMTRHDGIAYDFEIVRVGNIRYGRITQARDRNGNAITFAYQYPAPAVGVQTDSTAFQLDTATDAYGRVATFTYAVNQVGSRWVVERIDLPNGEHLTYEYGDVGGGNGFGGTAYGLVAVNHPDGSRSTFSGAFNSTSQALVMSIDDPAAGTTHRRKNVYLTPSMSWTGPGGEINIQGHNRVRMVVNGADEVSYFSWQGEVGGEMANFVYEGGNRLFALVQNNGLPSKRYFKRTFVGEDLGVTPASFANADWELETAAIGYDVQATRLNTTTDGAGNTISKQIDPVTGAVTQITYPDSSTRTTTYNNFLQPLTIVDRLGRQTDYTYDSNGNKLTKTEAVGKPEVATWTWSYNGQGQVTQATDANGNVTDFRYSTVGDPAMIDGSGYLVKIIDPADTPGGTRPETTYTYDSAGRITSMIDPLGRTTAYGYDSHNRTVLVTFDDGSTQTMTYADPVLQPADSGLMVAETDRNGNQIAYSFDAAGRRTQTIEADGSGVERVANYVYLEGTNKLVSVTDDGEATANSYDNRNRLTARQIQVDGATTLTSAMAYDNEDRVDFTTDPYGRRTFTVYDVNNRVQRSVSETIPGGLTAPDPTAYTDPLTYLAAKNSYLLGLIRSTGGNAAYLIDDRDYDAEGQLVSMTDPRNIITTYEYDDQGRRTVMLEAVGTSVEAKTEQIYDPQGNLVEVRSPRYFDSTDSRGFEDASTAMTYTGRNLLATRTAAPGTPEEATESYTYFLDRRMDTTTDARGNAFSKLWGICCARIMATLDPAVDVDGDGDTERAATITRHDFHGNLTHTGRVTDVDNVAFPNTSGNPTVFTDLPDSDTLQEITTRYDARHRPVATTIWLVPLPGVDPDAVPIAGGSLPGDPTVEIAGVVQGLTTTYAYDDDLTDNAGLDSTYAAAIAAELPAGFFASAPGNSADGYGVAVTNPEGETSVQFVDGAGRTVLTIDATGDASTMDYDTVVTVSGVGALLEVAATDPLGHVTKSQSDGAGRTLRTLDAENQVTTYTYDNNSNRLSFRDPVGVGEDCVYDARNREIECRDTQEIAESTVRLTEYDANNNVVRRTDAKGVDDTCVFDARDRQVSCTDRINATTTYTYDENSNLLTITDAEGGVTSYTYDPRNLQTRTEYPGHAPAPGSSFGDPNYDAVDMAYDALHRPSVKTDQLGDTTTFVYDLASRLTEKRHLANTGQLFRNLTFDTPGDYFPHGTSGSFSHTDTHDAPAGGNALVATVGFNSHGLRITTFNPYLQTGQLTKVSYWARTLNQTGSISFDFHINAGSPSNLTHVQALTDEWQYFEHIAVANVAHPQLYIRSAWNNPTPFTFLLDGLKIEQYDADEADTDTYTYDKASRLLTAESERYGNTVTYTYTDDSLIASENVKGNISSNPAGYTLFRGYDADDRLTSITYPNGSVVARQYTPRHQLSNITRDPDGLSNPLAAATLADFNYDPAMRETTRVLGTPGSGLTRTTAYARADHLPTAMTVESAPGLADRPGLSWSTYAYDANKNLTTATTLGVMANYSFTTSQDAEDRLEQWDRTNGESQGFTLSLVGDWNDFDGDRLISGVMTSFAETRTHNAVHEITGINATPVEYDAKGNLTLDEDGNTYTWDFDNRLQEVRDSNGDLLGSYTYDALGRRTTKTTPGSLPGDPQVTTAFVNLTSGGGMGQVLAEYEDNSLKRLYTYGEYIDEPVTMTRFDANLPGGDETLYYHRDRQYNIIGLTGEAGVVQERYAYTPYGERRVLTPDGVTVRQTSACGNPLGHQGLYHDEETNLIYNRARYRDAGLGRWIGREPLGYIDGMSLYNYVGNEPLNLWDPSGLTKIDDLFEDLKEKIDEGQSVGGTLKDIVDEFNDAGLDPDDLDDAQKELLDKGMGALTGVAGGVIDDLIDALDSFAKSSHCRQWYKDAINALESGDGCDKIYNNDMSGNYGGCWDDLMSAGGKAVASFEQLAKDAQSACCK